MCRAALQRIVVLLLLTFVSGVSVQAAPLSPMLRSFYPTGSVLDGGHCTPLQPACPLSGLAGCAAMAGCFAAVADSSVRLAPYTPHFRGWVRYIGQNEVALGLSVEPDLFPPIPSV